MKQIFRIGLVLCLISSAAIQAAAQSTEKTLRTYDWDSPEAQKNLPDSEIVSTDGTSVLKIENTSNTNLEISLLRITNSTIIKKAYYLSYEVKFKIPDVSRGHLMLYSPPPPGTSVGDARVSDPYGFGDIHAFWGDEGWNVRRININRYAFEGLPTELELHLSLPPHGIICLRSIKLLGLTSPWWSASQSGMVGGIVGVFGGLIGCFGGLLGCLAGFGKARKFVLTTTKIFIAMGMLLTITGIVAVLSGEPYMVWYVFLLPGITLTLIFSLNFPMIQRRYDDLEIRRMASMDAMRG